MIKIVKPENPFAVIESAGIKIWDFITIHHTANGVINPDRHWGKIIDEMHRGERGWECGLGYHFLINPDGIPEVGDRWIRQLDGAHNRGHNHESLGIAFVGNFSEPGCLPTSAQIKTFRAIRYNFSDIPLAPHCAFHNTECPGKNIDLKTWFQLFELKGE